MKALGRLAAMLGLSGFMFFIINALTNYMFLFTGSTKLLKEGGVPDDYYSFKPTYLFRITTNDKFDGKMVILISLMVGMILFWKLSKSFALWFRKIPDVDGSARWATEKEIDKSLFRVNSDKLEDAEKSGIILYRKDKYFFIDEATINSLIIGTTRSGKGQTFVLPMIRMLSQSKMKQSMVINDPKGELLENSYSILVSAGYKVVVLNLRDTNYSSLWNPLSPIISEYIKAMDTEEKDVSRVSELIGELAGVFTDNPKSDPIWPTSAKSLLSAIIMLLVSKGYENNCLDKLNMYSVYSFFLEYGVKNEVVGMKQINALDTLFQELPVGHPAKLSYATSNFATGEMRSSIFSTLASNIEIFADTGIAKLTSGNEIDFSDLINPEKPCAIFMVLPDEKVNRHVIASLFINQCYSALVDLAGNYPQQKLPQRIQFILDEFGNMVRIPSMDVKMTVCLGRNILFNLFVQDFNQLSSKYGDTSKTIRSNCGNLIYINSTDKETNDYISAILGSKTVEYETLSGNLDESLSHKNLSIKGRLLLTGDELGMLEMGEAVIKRQRCYPMRTKFDPFYKLNLPLTRIKEIIKVRSQSLDKIMFPFNEIFKEIDQQEAEEASREAVINKAGQLTCGAFVEQLKNENYTDCMEYINGFISENALPQEDIDILVCFIRDLYVKQQEAH